MAWLSSGRTNADLVDRMAANGLIGSDRVAEAMKAVDRGHYVSSKAGAYEDAPQRIGFNATISAPHMHAHACEKLLTYIDDANAQRGAILDVGSGSGYLTAVFHRLAPNATVIGIDHLEGLANLARTNLAKDGIEPGASSGIDIVCGDGRAGWPANAPYQVIHVGAAAPTIPDALVEQLASPGRMFIPVGTEQQAIWQVDKDAQGNVTKQHLFGVMYVPLTDRAKQWSGE